VKIIPFYDRTGLIQETLGTLNTALTEEILVTFMVVIFMLMNLRSSVLISGLLPLAVLMSFISMMPILSLFPGLPLPLAPWWIWES
jgi:Cu(I)/Ag(I) efflux system membrane protein CusA/SilA